MTDKVRKCSLAAAGIVGLLLLTGCLSTHPGSSSMAYVDIAKGGADVIRAEALRVFETEGYKPADGSSGVMVFEREATQRDQVVFGSYGQRLTMRVVVSIEPRPQGGHRVRADAYTVRNGFVDKMLRMSRRPYQKLLDRVESGVAKASRAK